MRLKDDTAGEERIGRRDLTRWPTRLGSALVRLVSALAAHVSAHAVLWITAAVGGALVIGLTVGGAEIYEAVEDGEGVAGWDRPLLDAAIEWRSATTNLVVTWFTNLGGLLGMSVITALITAAMVVRWHSRTPLVLMIIAVAGSLAMTSVGKIVVGRVRPPTADAVPPFESSPSFPSGHTLNSTVIAGLVAYLLLRRLTSRLARVLTVVLAAGCRGHGAQSRLPRPPLAHRRDGRLDPRPGLAGPRHHRAPAVPHGPPYARQVARFSRRRAGDGRRQTG